LVIIDGQNSKANNFIEADVIRWTEGVWSKKKHGRGRKSRNIIVGKQEVIGQITIIDKDFVSVKIIQAKITEKDCIKKIHPNKV